MAMQDAHEQEDSRSMFRGKSSKKGLSEMAGITFCSEGATNHVDWRVAMLVDLKTKTEPPPGGGSTFHAKREC
jgi:hypothetical protein